MNIKQLKKQLILNIPYIALGLVATNLGEAWRLASGTNMSEKVQFLMKLSGLHLPIHCRAYILWIYWWALPAVRHSGLQYI